MIFVFRAWLSYGMLWWHFKTLLSLACHNRKRFPCALHGFKHQLHLMRHHQGVHRIRKKLPNWFHRWIVILYYRTHLLLWSMMGIPWINVVLSGYGSESGTFRTFRLVRDLWNTLPFRQASLRHVTNRHFKIFNYLRKIAQNILDWYNALASHWFTSELQT